MKITFLILLAYTVTLANLTADTIILQNGREIEGKALQTNGQEVLILRSTDTISVLSSIIKEIKVEKTKINPTEPEAKRLASFKDLVIELARQTWADNLSQIPATVIDSGEFKNVPYLSFRCADDYEVNIYGDLDFPAAIEIGIYRKLLNSDEAKNNCLGFILSNLNSEADRQVLKSLSQNKDLKETNGFSFEITPATDADAYSGWWVTVYSKSKLDGARATDSEMQSISVQKSALMQQLKSSNGVGWSAADLAKSRPSRNEGNHVGVNSISESEQISFVDKSGNRVSNATVVRVVKGAYLIWRQGVSGGMVKLSELPESLQKRFAFDADRAAAVYAADEKDKNAYEAARAASIQAAQSVENSASSDAAGGYSSGTASGSGGRVFVSGYTRSNGTYVHSYTRSR